MILFLRSASDDWSTYLRTERGFSAHTIRAYSKDICDFISFLAQEEKPVKKINKYDIRRWLAFASKKSPKSATINRRLSSLKNFFQWMCRENLIESDPSMGIKRPKIPQKLPRFLDVNEAARVVEEPAQKGWYQIRNKAILELIYGTGIRVSEAANLDIIDVDFQDHLVNQCQQLK